MWESEPFRLGLIFHNDRWRYSQERSASIPPRSMLLKRIAQECKADRGGKRNITNPLCGLPPSAEPAIKPHSNFRVAAGDHSAWPCSAFSGFTAIYFQGADDLCPNCRDHGRKAIIFHKDRNDFYPCDLKNWLSPIFKLIQGFPMSLSSTPLLVA